MKCPSCEKEIEVSEKVRFCQYCGAGVELTTRAKTAPAKEVEEEKVEEGKKGTVAEQEKAVEKKEETGEERLVCKGSRTLRYKSRWLFLIGVLWFFALVGLVVPQLERFVTFVTVPERLRLIAYVAAINPIDLIPFLEIKGVWYFLVTLGGISSLFGLGILVVLLWVTKMHRFRSTTKRLIIITGLIGRDEDEVMNRRILDFKIRQNRRDRILGIGNISVYTMDASDAQVVLVGVSAPKKKREQMWEVVEEVKKKTQVIEAGIIGVRR